MNFRDEVARAREEAGLPPVDSGPEPVRVGRPLKVGANGRRVLALSAYIYLAECLVFGFLWWSSEQQRSLGGIFFFEGIAILLGATSKSEAIALWMMLLLLPAILIGYVSTRFKS